MKEETLNRAIKLRKLIENGKNNLTRVNNWKYRAPDKLHIKTGDVGVDFTIEDPEVIIDLLYFLSEEYENILFKRKSEFDSL